MAGISPIKVTIRSYDVGFGDCFLLTFHYKNQDRHVLIDFGSMRHPTNKTVTKNYMNHIAHLIKADCGGKLHVIVATHRHQDHISGFARRNGRGPGEIIRDLQPEIVIQPWTEDSHAAEDATKPTTLRGLHLRTLKQMQIMADNIVRMTKYRGSSFEAFRRQIVAIGMDNIKNEDAVRNLQEMAPNQYMYYGKSLNLAAVLPGVKARVLGPPTLEQTRTIIKQRSEDPDEFWHVNAAFWKRQLRTADKHGLSTKSLFPKKYQGQLPRAARWFRYNAMRERTESLLSIVRIIDNAMNNTSLILLFEVNGKRFLFPGDAQFENWMYALSKDKVLKDLSKVDLYKVGHHGSLNATPKTLWNRFSKRNESARAERLMTFLSTKADVHGSEENKTEVPRNTLVNALKKDSTLCDTSTYRSDEFVRSVTIPI